LVRFCISAKCISFFLFSNKKIIIIFFSKENRFEFLHLKNLKSEGILTLDENLKNSGLPAIHQSSFNRLRHFWVSGKQLKGFDSETQIKGRSVGLAGWLYQAR